MRAVLYAQKRGQKNSRGKHHHGYFVSQACFSNRELKLTIRELGLRSRT